MKVRATSGQRLAADGARSAFTLIEIMIVVALIGLICTTAIPSIYTMAKKTGMRRAAGDLRDVCTNARMQAIFTGKTVYVVFFPLDRRFYISGGGGGTSASADAEGGRTGLAPEVVPGTETTGIIPEDVTLEMLDVNQLEYKDSEWTQVRFFPNGTCDELTIVYRSDDNQYRRFTLEAATSLLTQGEVR